MSQMKIAKYRRRMVSGRNNSISNQIKVVNKNVYKNVIEFWAEIQSELPIHLRTPIGRQRYRSHRYFVIYCGRFSIIYFRILKTLVDRV